MAKEKGVITLQARAQGFHTAATVMAAAKALAKARAKACYFHAQDATRKLSWGNLWMMMAFMRLSAWNIFFIKVIHI